MKEIVYPTFVTLALLCNVPKVISPQGGSFSMVCEGSIHSHVVFEEDGNTI